MSDAHPIFPHLFSPISIGRVKLHNRIAISAHHAGWFVDRGLPSDELVAYLQERAKGGAALFVIGATTPEPWPGCVENIDETIIPRYRALVEAAHRHGTAVFAQLFHPGFGPLPGPPIVSPPPMVQPTQPMHREPPRAQPTIERLRSLVELFGAAAGRAAQGGVDGVELHSHESFLHAQMLNPLWNTRRDIYGGSLDNRMRFMIETLTAMRKAIGPQVVLGVRLKLDDALQRGMSGEDYVEAVKRLEVLNLVDYLSFTSGDGRLHHGPMARPEGEWLGLVKAMRTHTNLPVMHAGRINTPEMAERAVSEGAVDIVCMTKAHIADPQFSIKAFENRLGDIRYCTRCLQSCHGNIPRMTCVYNPLTSRETIWAKTSPAIRKRRVIIIGGGPAGMEAAITAAARGHEVIVLEKESRVGGQVWLGASSPLRGNWARIAEFYERQCAKGEFEVRVGIAATTSLVNDLRPDVVVLATGSKSLDLKTPGLLNVYTVEQTLQGALDSCKRVLVFDREGFNRPLVVTDYLSSRGIEVDFVTPMLRVSPLAEEMTLDEMLEHFSRRSVRFHPGCTIGGTGSRTIDVRSVQTGAQRQIEVDAVVAAIGAAPVDELLDELRNVIETVHVIGDANIPQTLEQATYQGARIGRLI